MPKPSGQYADQGASIEDAYRDLDREDFLALMAEAGYDFIGPAEKPPVQAPAQSAGDVTREDRLNAIRARIRELLNQGYRLNPNGASKFTADEMLQRRMGSYGAGLGAGTGNSAEILSDRIKRGQ